MAITNKTQLNAVIGYPLAHTQSPNLHNFIYETLNLDAILLSFSHQSLESLIQSIRTLSMGLVAVTMPFKEKILPYLDECCPSVRAVKAANTIINQHGKLMGYNTDIDGVAFALKNISMNNKNILMIGAGGAARAAAYFLQKYHVNIFWYNRSKENALQMSSEFGGNVISHLQNISDKIDVIINTSPVGMYPEVYATPLPSFKFHPEQIVLDMIYYPCETRLLKDAKSQGAKIISGLNMFIGQGIRQIELWTKQKIFSDDLFNNLQTLLKKGLV